MKNRILIVAIYILLNVNSYAQGVAIGEKDFEPHAAALLELRSNVKGLLIPRLSCKEKNEMNIDRDALGLLIFQTDSMAGFYYFNAEKWIHIGESPVSLCIENFSWEYDSLKNTPVLFSGIYDSLLNKPNLFSGEYDSLKNKPHLFTGNYDSLSDKPMLFNGEYDSLKNKPLLFDGDYRSLSNKPSLFSGKYMELQGKPNLSIVATTGSYNDLLDKPILTTDSWIPSAISHQNTTASVEWDLHNCRWMRSGNIVKLWATGWVFGDLKAIENLPVEPLNTGTFTNEQGLPITGIRAIDFNNKEILLMTHITNGAIDFYNLYTGKGIIDNCYLQIQIEYIANE